MTYPQAPWTLQGYAILALYLLDINRVRYLLPQDLEIISPWPGKTFGGVYLSYYGSESVLKYHELIVVPALVSCRGKMGGWVSHIYVDNPDSVAGGREIWGLPKQLAKFTWEKDHRVTVSQDQKVLCSLSYNKPFFAWPQWFSGSSFSARNSDLLFFLADCESRLGLVSSKIDVPPESPFAEIGLGEPFVSIHCDRMNLRVHTPEIIGKTTFAYS